MQNAISSEPSYDLFVIGGGSGGVRAARLASQAGLRVALAEASQMGGTCVNAGCVPKKLYRYAADGALQFHEAAGFGWSVQSSFDWSVLKLNRAREIRRLNQVYARLLDIAGVHVIAGYARLVDAYTVRVGDRQYRASKILIAVGCVPAAAGFPGAEHAITSDDIFDLPVFPRRLVVVGAGYIACEFSSMFQALGSQVVQVHRGPGLLRGFDAETAAFAFNEMRKSGVDFMLDERVDSIGKSGDALTVRLESGRTLEADAVLYAGGRVANVAGLGLELVGVQLPPSGLISTDERFRTTVPTIHAIGDAASTRQLTPVALAEATAFVKQLLEPPSRAGSQATVDHEFLPSAVFTHPAIATVGYSEEAAAAKFGSISVFTTDFKPLKHTLSGSAERTFMKVVVDRRTDRVLGVHVVAADAGELIQGFAVALRAGATKSTFDATIGIHPTAAEELVTLRAPVRVHGAAATTGETVDA